MARPKMDEAEKKQSISFRLSPASKERIAEEAAKNGHGIPSEIEARIERFIDLDSSTLDLLAQIGKEALEIQQHYKCGPWHQHLEAWAAVAHMLRTGPIMLTRPCSPTDDAEVQEAREKLDKLTERRKALVTQAREVNIAWVDEVAKPTSSGQTLGGLLSSYIAPDPREVEAKSLSLLDEGGGKDMLIKMHDEVRDLDKQIAQAHDEWISTLTPYWNDEKGGARWNQRRQKEKAERALHEGRPYDIHQLMGVDPWL